MELIRTINWTGKHVSANKFYSGTHWRKRKKIVDDFNIFFSSLFMKRLPKLQEYRLELTFNSQLDPSNTWPMIKILEDYLVKKGIVEDDTKEFCKGLSFAPDTNLKNNEYKIKIYGTPRKLG